MEIVIENLTFKYEIGDNILNQLNINIIEECIISIVGLSGSGKSTLLRLIAGLLQTNTKQCMQGSIKINGMDPIKYRQRGKLSFMFQEPALMPNLNLFDNISLPFIINGNAKKKLDTINTIINSVGLRNHTKYFPSSLSGGMKTRAALARSFITEPELILLDEPFSSLDIAWKTELYNELKELQRKYKTTILIVTHDIEEALFLSDRILVLGYSGKVMTDLVVKNNTFDKSEEIKDAILKQHAERYINL